MTAEQEYVHVTTGEPEPNPESESEQTISKLVADENKAPVDSNELTEKKAVDRTAELPPKPTDGVKPPQDWLFIRWAVGALVVGGVVGGFAGWALRDTVTSARSIAAFALLLIAFFDTLALGRVASTIGDYEADDYRWKTEDERGEKGVGRAKEEAQRAALKEFVSLLQKSTSDGKVPAVPDPARSVIANRLVDH